MRRPCNPSLWVGVILFASYAYFWQSRDWNSASRLALTYAIVDRGTVSIDGMEDQTGDRARFQGHSYSDKLPGFSFLATGPYLAAKSVLGLRSNPLHVRDLAYWPADYWVTLLTSGLSTALCGMIIVGVARELGCSPRASGLLGLAYGLGTPAYAYATMSYGHQITALALLGSFVLLWRSTRSHQSVRVVSAGFLAAYASVVELQVGPVSAILGLYLLAQVLAGVRKPAAVGEFAVGALIPTLLLLGYNLLAFGSPWEMGYFHHATQIFANVHNAGNPLGLGWPDSSRVRPLLWGRYRGLAFYAPLVLLVPVGLGFLVRARQWGLGVVSATTMLAIFVVNLSYPEWTGGWSTGPRLLVPLLPFAMLPVAQAVASGGRLVRRAAAILGFTGALVMLLFVSVGGRIPQFHPDPLVNVVWPLWTGRRAEGWIGDPFAWNLTRLAAPDWTKNLPARLQFVQILPLVLAQLGLIAWMVRVLPGDDPTPSLGLDLGVDQEKDGSGQNEQAKDPGTESSGMTPDTGPRLVTGGGIDETDRHDEGNDVPVDVNHGERHHAEVSGSDDATGEASG